MIKPEIVEKLHNTKLWVFDLDDTLYPRECGLWAEISDRINIYVQNLLKIDDKEELQIMRRYFIQNYGGALKGLIEEYDVDREDYLAFVHDVDYSLLKENPPLKQAINNLQGKKYIFTNGDEPHAKRSLQALGLTHCFDAIFDIVKADYIPKPYPQAYEKFLHKFNINPQHTVMVEDNLANLKTCKQLGMTTIWIKDYKNNQMPDYVDYSATTINNLMQKIWEHLDER